MPGYSPEYTPVYFSGGLIWAVTQARVPRHSWNSRNNRSPTARRAKPRRHSGNKRDNQIPQLAGHSLAGTAGITQVPTTRTRGAKPCGHTGITEITKYQQLAGTDITGTAGITQITQVPTARRVRPRGHTGDNRDNQMPTALQA